MGNGRAAPHPGAARSHGTGDRHGVEPRRPLTWRTVSRDGSGRLWDAETGREIWQAPVPNEGISVAFHPDGRTIAFGGDDGRITLWQVDPLTKLTTLAHGSWGFPHPHGLQP